MDTTPWDDVKTEMLAEMTPAERAEFDAAGESTELAFRLAELVYDARTRAGLSQTELARRMGTSQSVISTIEGGGQVPTVAMLIRVARATGQHLQLDLFADPAGLDHPLTTKLVS